MPTKHLSYAEAGYEGITFEGILQEWLAIGVVTVNEDGKILTATPEAERLLEWRKEKQSRALEDLPDMLQSIASEAKKAGQIVPNRQVGLQTAAGQLRLDVTAVPVSGSEANGAVVLILKDLTAAGKLEKQIQRLDRLAGIGTLSAGMAHEIKNALVAVKTFVDLLLERNQEAELAGIVRREMNRVDSIVGQMLRFAVPARPAFAAVSLHNILDHSLRLIQHRNADKLISFTRRLNAEKDSLHGDEHLLEQAIVNLLFNAVEAMGGEGTLTVSTELILDDNGQLHEGAKAPMLLRMRISDTGTGIAPENLTRIFEPFFTTKKHGTGLGLPVTRRIIEEHGGKIEVESQLHEGTTFVISLPACIDA